MTGEVEKKKRLKLPNVHENYWEKGRRTKVKENEWKEKISLKEERLRKRKKILELRKILKYEIKLNWIEIDFLQRWIKMTW